MDTFQIMEEILYEAISVVNNKIDEKVEEYRTNGVNPDEIYMEMIDELDRDRNALTLEVLDHINKKMEQSGAI